MTDHSFTTTAATLRLLAPRELAPSLDTAVAHLPEMFAMNGDELRTFCAGWSGHMPAVLAVGRLAVGWLRIDPVSKTSVASAVVTVPAVQTLLVTPSRLQPAPEPRSDLTLAAGGILLDVLGAPERAATRFKDAFGQAMRAQPPAASTTSISA